MNVNIGDRVRFLDDVGEGIITKISNKNIAYVLMTDGFEVPAHIENLVVIEKAAVEKQNTNNESIDISYNYIDREEYSYADFAEEIEGNDNPSVFMAYLPETELSIDNTNKVSIFLINDCNYFLSYIFSTIEDNTCRYLKHGVLEPNMKFHICTLSLQEISAMDKINIQLLFFKTAHYSLIKPIDRNIKIPHQKFFKPGCFETNDFFEEKALITDLTSDIEQTITDLSTEEIAQINQEKQASEMLQKKLSARYSARPEPETMEVDLHINQLLVDCRGMSNSEIIEVQIKHFHKKLKEALEAKNIGKVVFIHGIGNGTLKNEVRKTLSQDYPKLKFQDASFKEYGFGATMVML